MRWAELEGDAPDIGMPGRQLLEDARLALLGTLRPDGSPRISPIEPYLAADELVFGVMAWSAKRRDLARDARCVLHSVVSEPDAGTPELKLYGRADELPQSVREEVVEGWWLDRPAEAAVVFALRIELAVLAVWDVDRAEVTLRRWSPRRGPSASRRAYP